MLVAHHLGVHRSQVEIGRAVFTAAGENYFRFSWFAQQGLHDRLDRQQLQIHCRVDLIEDHRFVEAARDGGPGDLPGPLSFHVVDRLLLATPHDCIAPGAQVIHQVGIALAKSGYGGIFGIASATFEPLQNQHPVAFVLADATADRL